MPRSTILIVDDNPENLTVLGELLHGSYKVRAANSGARALQLAQQEPLPDLILLDVMMPGMNGYEVLQRLRSAARTAEIPVIFTTAMTATEDERRGLTLGAVDYLTKPLRPSIVLARVRTHLELKQARDALQRHNATLEEEVARHMRDTLLVQDLTIRGLARLAETRDNETGNHILRTQYYVETLARRVARQPHYAAALDERTIMLMAKSAPLHDIGKVGIPDAVLLKPGKLDAAEWVVMKTHAKLGADALARAEIDANQQVPFLSFAKQIAHSHHEKWDGSGYPDGLAGENIPLAARLMAVADVFDALISRRVYKAPMPLDQVCAIMAEQRGKHFDPNLIDAFFESLEDFCAIARRYPDEHEAVTAGAATLQPAAAMAATQQPAAATA